MFHKTVSEMFHKTVSVIESVKAMLQ